MEKTSGKTSGKQAQRYHVGKKYYFIDVQFQSSSEEPSTLYIPWRDKLKGIKIIELTCVKHQRVPESGSNSQEKVHDGFIFKLDGDDIEWYNQYPQAMLGRFESTADWRVRRNVLFMNSNERNVLRNYEDVVWVLENIALSQYTMERNKCVNELESLLEFRQKIFDLLEKQYKIKVRQTTNSIKESLTPKVSLIAG